MDWADFVVVFFFFWFTRFSSLSGLGQLGLIKGFFFFFLIKKWVGPVKVEAKRWAVFGLGRMCLIRLIRSGRSRKWLKKWNRGI